MQGIHWWVRKWAELRGASPAVTCDGETVSWRELDRRVDVLARHFDSLGVRAGDRVGCLMPNCVEFIVALHAASRVGAIFVPLNIRYTATELGFAARHAGLAALAVDESFAELVAAAGLPVPAERVLWRGRLPDEGPRWDRASPAGGDDDGFLLFTSGSTGTPRAVLHSQAAFLWTSMDPVLMHHYSHSDVMVSPMPLCFTGGLNVATALAHCGGELVLMSGVRPRHRVRPDRIAPGDAVPRRAGDVPAAARPPALEHGRPVHAAAGPHRRGPRIERPDAGVATNGVSR